MARHEKQRDKVGVSNRLGFGLKRRAGGNVRDMLKRGRCVGRLDDGGGDGDGRVGLRWLVIRQSLFGT